MAINIKINLFLANGLWISVSQIFKKLIRFKINFQILPNDKIIYILTLEDGRTIRVVPSDKNNPNAFYIYIKGHYMLVAIEPNDTNLKKFIMKYVYENILMYVIKERVEDIIAIPIKKGEQKGKIT